MLRVALNAWVVHVLLLSLSWCIIPPTRQRGKRAGTPAALLRAFPVLLRGFGRGEQINLQIASGVSNTEMGERYEENHRNHVGDT